jgi:hypothetical protein
MNIIMILSITTYMYKFDKNGLKIYFVIAPENNKSYIHEIKSNKTKRTNTTYFIQIVCEDEDREATEPNQSKKHQVRLN